MSKNLPPVCLLLMILMSNAKKKSTHEYFKRTSDFSASDKKYLIPTYLIHYAMHCKIWECGTGNSSQILCNNRTPPSYLFTLTKNIEKLLSKMKEQLL